MEKARVEQIQELEKQKHETEEIYRKRLEEAEKKLDDAKESHREQLVQMEITMREKENAPKKEVEKLQKVKEELESVHKEQVERLNRKVRLRKREKHCVILKQDNFPSDLPRNFPTLRSPILKHASPKRQKTMPKWLLICKICLRC